MSGRLAEYKSPLRQGSSYLGQGEYAGDLPIKGTKRVRAIAEARHLCRLGENMNLTRRFVAVVAGVMAVSFAMAEGGAEAEELTARSR